MTYEVSFEKNGVPQVHIVCTNLSPVEVGLYYRDVKHATYVYGVKLFDGHIKPSQPIVCI